LERGGSLHSKPESAPPPEEGKGGLSLSVGRKGRKKQNAGWRPASIERKKKMILFSSKKEKKK